MIAFSKILRPLSLRMLILFGFILAVFPLVIALVSAVKAIDQLVVFSQETAYRVARMSGENEAFRERLIDFERQAKRYLILDDEDSHRALEDAHRTFVEVLDSLMTLAQEPSLAAQLSQVAEDGETIYQRLSARPQEKPEKPDKRNSGDKSGKRHNSSGMQERPLEAEQLRVDKADEFFSALSGKARELVRTVARASDDEVKNLQTHSESVRQRMLLQASVLLPVSLALISLLTYLIIRSVHQMDLAIRRLGSGDFLRPIQVRGPKDLEYLGERLDWLRSRLRSLEDAKAQFMRHVSHDLKTPLATIHEGTGLLADEVVGELNTEQREITQILVSNTQKLETLIEELINYSQVNARPGALPRERVDVGRLLEAVIEDNQIRLRAKSITVKESARNVAVSGNPEQLRTIIDNLLSNAIKYSPPGREIRIDLRQTGGHMALEIEDDGPGIDPDERKQVFEPFFQGKAAKEGGVGGTGLGLAIVSECVAGHHGKVEALEPRPDKKGARIRVQIPLRQDD